MKSMFLGTGASEAIPCIYCECDICKRARLLKGKNIRSRTAFMIDEFSIIDVSPDLFYQMNLSGRNLREMKQIFLTHYHEDHISMLDLSTRTCGFPSLDFQVKLYGTVEALEALKLNFDLLRDHTHPNPGNYFDGYDLTPLESFKTYDLDGLEVTPIISSHWGYGVKELGFNYIIKDRHGNLFLYAVDTGWYYDQTWDFLAQYNLQFDYIVMECTYGEKPLPRFQDGHLNLTNIQEMLEKFEKMNLITKTTPIYLTHICHVNTLSHEELQAFVDSMEFYVVVAHDGMELL